MKIDSYNITMSSKSILNEIHTKEENLNIWVGNKNPDTKDKGLLNPNNNEYSDILQISEEGKAMAAEESSVSKSNKTDDEFVFELTEKDKAKVRLLQIFLERLTGKKLKFMVPEKLKITLDELPKIKSAAVIPVKQGWGLEYDYREFNYEKQEMSFNSAGTVKTSDGREINFNISLNMSREFMSNKSISIRAGDAVLKDPLVVNFNDRAPKLTETKYSFDIDSDGEKDQISFVSPDSGFLALDIDNNGKINNGKELFGTESGDGFSDLALYDSDKNNWIDENDEIYSSLRIWTKDENGNDRLFALGQKGIGAIYLGNVNTDYNLKNSQNSLDGVLRKTGVFLREDGSAGIINHIDLAI